MPLLWRRRTKTLFGCVNLLWLGVLCVPVQTQAADYFSRHQAYAALNCETLQRNGSSGNCLDTLLDLANLELNQRYDQLMTRYQQSNVRSKTVSDTVDRQLLTTQYQWLQFRNQQCLFEAQASTLTAAQPTTSTKTSNPSTSPPNKQQASNQQSSNQVKLCQLALTRERIEYLQWFLAR